MSEWAEDAETVRAIIQRAVKEKVQATNSFVLAYLSRTGAKIEDTVLVEHMEADGTLRYWCEPKGQGARLAALQAELGLHGPAGTPIPMQQEVNTWRR